MKIILGCLVFAWTSTSFGHARWSVNAKNTLPRSNATGLKTAPCGGVDRTKNAKVFKPGAKLLVEWEETIDHPGYFKILISKKDDEDFEELVANFPDTQDQPIVGDVFHDYSTTITLPNYECTDCTLQLIQVMEEDPDNPGYYYSCSDIELSENGATKTEDDASETTDTPTDIEAPTDLKLRRLK